ncbi:phage tail sheath C-terminal domain-containing protein [Serratia fonticola]|uniref:Phage tail sheath C-terminal domain-containing protein n=1 Tax=Serratia fonticola TaxID=47917 RepID=A0AAJ1YF76_SERFO|nr:phage tail sheath C-terminal domain-containing protein [Serratia fonticola]MDQ9128536.1 phage tail sheath C-terminal domain-containing protein [Serratia fonticola]
MMGKIQPGITLSDNIVPTSQNVITTATPVFIGYTEQVGKDQLEVVATRVDSLADYTQTFSSKGIMAFAVRHYFDNGGEQAFILSLPGNMPSDRITESEAADFFSALQSTSVSAAIASEPLITLILAPDMARFNDGLITNRSTLANLWSSGWAMLLQLSQTKPNLFVLLDAPDDVDVASHCLQALSSDYRQWGAAYWPRVETTYRDTSVAEAEAQRILLSPTAAIAAVIQRTDRSVGVWKAPANVVLAQAIRPIVSHLQGDALFNASGTSLNLIRSFPGKGIRIWGCRTLENSANSPWRYLQTRRLVSYVAANLAQLIRLYTFEPNNELTWIKCKGQSYNWLRQLWLQGGLYGAQEDEAFNVLLGLNETMTEDDVRAGKMIVKIELAILFPAEFIEISLVFDTRTGALLS